MMNSNFAVAIKTIAMVFVFGLLAVTITLSQTSKPTPISGSNTISYNTTDNAYHFLAAEGIDYAYYLYRPDYLRGTLNALVVYDTKNNYKYFFPSQLGGITAKLNDSTRGPCNLEYGADMFCNYNNVTYELINHYYNSVSHDTVTVNWKMRYGTDSCSYRYIFSINGQTLTIKMESDETTKIHGIGLCAAFSPNNKLYVINVPCLPITNVLYDKELNLFATLYTDWETTNASGITPWISGDNNTVHDYAYYSQKIFYEHKTTNNLRNKLNETIYLSVSSDLKNVLPNIDGPVAPNRGNLSDKFFISYYQPYPNLNYPHHEIPGQTPTVKYLDGLYNYYGVRDAAFIVKNWSNGQFDYHWPDNWPVDPFNVSKGEIWPGQTIDSLKAIRGSIRTKGFLFGLHENYIMTYPASQWGPASQWQTGKLPSGNTAIAYYYKYAVPPQMNPLLSPSVINTTVTNNLNQMLSVGPDFSYLDFATGMNPSGPGYDEPYSFVDFNSSLGNDAGKFKYTLSKIRELGRHVGDYYHCPVQGEGGYQFLYAGYYDDFDGRIETGAPQLNGDGIRGYKAPLLLEFAQKIREKSSSHGAGHIGDFFNNYTTSFSDAQVKIFMATEMAYGNGGLVSTMNRDIQDHSLKHACWEQQCLLWVQKMYANAKPVSTLYGNGDGEPGLTVSQYISAYPLYADITKPDFMSRVKITYDNGVIVYVNRSMTPWTISSMSSMPANGSYFYNIKNSNGIDIMGNGARPDSLNTQLKLPAENGWLCYSPYWPNGAVISGPKEIAGSWGYETQGAGVAAADVDNNGKPELFTFWIDNPSGPNTGYYRVGRNMDASGTIATSNWSENIAVKPCVEWGYETQGADIAISNVGKKANPDMVLFWVDNPSGANIGHYRIGWDMDTMGRVADTNWSSRKTVPVTSGNEFGYETDGAGVAIATIGHGSQPDLVLFWIDDPIGANIAYYRIGWDLDPNTGVVSNWSDRKIAGVATCWGYENQGAGIAINDINGDGKLDIVASWIDNPAGKNQAYFRVGWDLDTNGNLTSWSDPSIISESLDGDEHQGAGVTITQINNNAKPGKPNLDLVFFDMLNPVGANRAFYRIGYDIGVDHPILKKSTLANNESIPKSFELLQNYPNPFNPTTTIEFALPMDSKVTLIIYDLLGREVRRPIDGTIKAGYHKIVVNASSLSTGVYFYRIVAGNFAQTRKLLLLK